MSVVTSYLRHRLHAKSRHGVHSPFVYTLIEDVFKARGAHRQDDIETLRRRLKRDRSPIEVVDLGAGPRKDRGPQRTVASIARHSATPPTRAAMMQRLIDHLGLSHILELGANLGLTTAYLASAKACRRCTSIEGDPTLAGMAREHLARLDLQADILVGSIDHHLEEALRDMGRVDFAYLDGNHRQKPTLHYFDSILPYTTEESVVVVGDIHWSAGMEQAWLTIKNHPQVQLTLDLFDLGIVFFKTDRAKQHFTLRY